MPAPLAAILPAAAGLASNLIPLVGNKQRNKMEMQESARERAYNLAMWEKQNEYNHPIRQMSRLKSAGLNPRLVYGQASGAAAGNAGDVKGYSRPELQTVTDGMKGFEPYYEFKNIEARTNNVDADTVGKSIQNAREGIKLGVDNVTQLDLVSKIKADARSANSQANITAVQNRVMSATIEEQIKKIGADASNAQIRRDLNRLELDLNETLKPFGLTARDPVVVRAIMSFLFQQGGSDLVRKAVKFLIP